MSLPRTMRWILTGLCALLVTAGALYAWSYWPISADTQATDPAVTLATELSENKLEYSEGFVESQGDQIHYVSAGKGETIVFLHGFPSYWFTMYGLMDEFGRDHRVVAIDGLGVGKSDGPGSVESYKIDRLVQHLDDVIDRLDLGRVHLVGHDWGAAIATGYVQAHPGNVRTLTAIGALPHNVILSRLDSDPQHREVFSYMSTFTSANPVLIRLLGVKEQIWEGIYAPFVQDGIISEAYGGQLRADIGNARRTDRFINWYRANFPDFDKIEERDFWPARNARITVPALFVYSKDDNVVTPELVDDLQNLSDSMTVLSFKEAGHRPHFTRKKEVIAAIRTLLAGGT